MGVRRAIQGVVDMQDSPTILAKVPANKFARPILIDSNSGLGNA
jgi:hypothetical protein